MALAVEDGLPYQAASWHLCGDLRVFVPFATIQNWVEARGKKLGRQKLLGIAVSPFAMVGALTEE